jgi:hypothetical protein
VIFKEVFVWRKSRQLSMSSSYYARARHTEVADKLADQVLGTRHPACVLITQHYRFDRTQRRESALFEFDYHSAIGSAAFWVHMQNWLEAPF